MGRMMLVGVIVSQSKMFRSVVPSLAEGEGASNLSERDLNLTEPIHLVIFASETRLPSLGKSSLHGSIGGA